MLCGQIPEGLSRSQLENFQNYKTSSSLATFAFDVASFAFSTSLVVELFRWKLFAWRL